MSASHLSIICSGCAIFITSIKLVTPVWRLYHEYTLKSGPTIMRKIWLDTGISVILVILSGLLLAFSLVRPEGNALQLLLSVAGGVLITYQIMYLSMYGVNRHRPLWLPPLICFLVIATINILASSVDYTKASKILVPIIFSAEYVVIFLTYWFSYDRFLQKTVRKLIYWNMAISCTEGAVALTSLVLYLTGKCSLTSCLWLSKAVAMMWVMWVTWMQWSHLQRDRSQPTAEVSSFDNPNASDEKLVFPPAAFMANSGSRGLGKM